jgi:hypothetical protein
VYRIGGNKVTAVTARPSSSSSVGAFVPMVASSRFVSLISMLYAAFRLEDVIADTIRRD